MALATGDDLIEAFDAGLVGELASDSDSPEAVARDEIATHPVVLKALSAASGEVLTALRAGGRYTAAQLEALEGDDREHLAAIVCSLAMARLFKRRPEARDKDTIELLTKDGRDAIKALRDGVDLFGFDAAVAASVIDADGPTALDLQNRNGLTERMYRAFPDSRTRLPLDRG